MPYATPLLGALSLVVWLIGALVSFALADATTHSTTVWLASGVTFGLVLVVPRWQIGAVLAGAGLGSTIIALQQGLSVAGSVAFGVNEALSIGAGALLARWARLPRAAGSESATRRQPLSVPQVSPGLAYAGLVAGAAVTAAVGACIAVVLWSWLRPGARLFDEWIVWATSGFVGVLLLAPLFAAFQGFRPRRSGGLGMTGFAAGALAFALFIAVAALVFRGSATERFGVSIAATLAYLPLPFIVITAVLWGERGGLLAVLAGALLLIRWTDTGGGPFSASEGFRGEAVIEVQGYVAVMALLVGVVLALSNGRDRALREAQAWRWRYRQALESNRSVTLTVDAVTGRCDWGEGAAAVWGDSVPPTVEAWIDAADTGDQALMRADWAAVGSGQRRALQWHFERGGAAHPVRAQLAAVLGPDGRVEQLAGIVQAQPDSPVAEAADGR